MSTLAGSYVGEFNVPECWGFDCLYGEGDIQFPPEPLCVHATHRHTHGKTLEDWKARTLHQIERKWLDWTAYERKFFAYWTDEGGTLQRTANLDLLSMLFLNDGVVVIPKLYDTRLMSAPFQIVPPRPRVSIGHFGVMKDNLIDRIKRFMKRGS